MATRPKKIGKVNLFKIDYAKLGKEKGENSPTYNISGELDGIGKVEGAGWVSQTKKGETYLSCNINEPFDKGGVAPKKQEDDDLPF
jgi:uncharacterized protein (DUF736 family)|tara:strand:+ start:769 stop:1026 length:258 start_codon:yes stop_codon:yes gene_type:complete